MYIGGNNGKSTGGKRTEIVLRGRGGIGEQFVWGRGRYDSRTPFAKGGVRGKARARDGDFVDIARIVAVVCAVCVAGILQRKSVDTNGVGCDGRGDFGCAVARKNACENGEFGICGVASGGRGVFDNKVKFC